MLSVAKTKRDWAEVKKNVKFSINSTKETVTITKAEPVLITGKPNLEKKEACPSKTQ